MTKFHGIVGFGSTAELRPGVYQDVIVERPYYGDVLQNSQSSRANSDTVNNDITLSKQLRILSDSYSIANYLNIRFVEWNGKMWTVRSSDIARPRLILSLGDIYNGNRQTT
jgi:hypothetical protein